jgi:hypothetical protein
MCIIVDGMTDFQQRIGGFFHQKQVSKAEIRRVLGLLLRPGEVHEVRVLKHRLGTIAGFYDDPDKLASDAWELTEGLASVENRWGKQELVGDVGSVYVTLNPVKGHKLALAGMDNRFRVVPAKKDRDESGWLTEDQDITRRHLILIDNDPCRGGRKSGVSSSFGRKSGVSSSFGGNPVSVHHSCPKRRTDTGFPRPSILNDWINGRAPPSSVLASTDAITR